MAQSPEKSPHAKGFEILAAPEIGKMMFEQFKIERLPRLNHPTLKSLISRAQQFSNMLENAACYDCHTSDADLNSHGGIVLCDFCRLLRRLRGK